MSAESRFARAEEALSRDPYDAEAWKFKLDEAEVSQWECSESGRLSRGQPLSAH